MWINYDYQYNYVNYRRCHVAYNNYYHRRGNGFERQYPNRSFSNRNSGYTNRYELEKTRSTTRKDVAYNTTRNIDRNSTVRSNSTTRNENSPVRENTRAISNQTRSQNIKFENSPVRETTRAISNQTRSNSNVQTKIESSSRNLGLQSSRYSENRSQSETSRANSGSGRR
jgi:DNA-dependent RNA polymerase auxiliary subunit epsilon